MKFKKYLCIAGLLFLLFSLYANEMAWWPVNPSFGGNSYNGSWLQSSAQAQNLFEENDGYSYEKPSAVEQFEENLNRLILNKLANKIVNAVYEGDEVQTGQFEMGNYLIDVNQVEGSIVIVIDDMLSGSQTIIEVPYED